MKIQKNEGNIDRIIRALLGVILLVTAYLFLGGILQIIFYVAAGVMLFTALTGFCGLYKIIGINTAK